MFTKQIEMFRIAMNIAYFGMRGPFLFVSKFYNVCIAMFILLFNIHYTF